MTSQSRRKEWNDVMSLVKYINEHAGNVRLLESYHYGFNKFNSTKCALTLEKLSDINTWSTYSQCIELRYHAVEKHIVLNATIWDGHILDGRRTDKRFTAKFFLPNSFVSHIAKSVEWKFDSIVRYEYEDYLALLRIEWMFKRKIDIIHG